ncbi:MAG TPA: HYR domain-containing protein, partial [Verrucomicrobiae bacterium]
MRTLLVSVFACCLALGPVAKAASFSNPTAISLNEPAAPLPPTAGSPYPSTILVSGAPGTISKVVVRLNNINHNRADDMDVLLVGPTGVKFVFLSDAGGTAVPVVNATVTFDDTAATQIPDIGPLVAGTFRPSGYSPSPDVFPAPAPSGPYNSAAPEGIATFASVFNGTDANGTWSLYLVDDTANGGQIANIAGGWNLEITTVDDLPTMTTLTSTPNPSFTTAPDNVVTFTATVTSGGFTVPFGTVTFTEGATILQGPTPVDANGQAQFVTSTLSAGTHVIVAHYDGVPDLLNVSSGSTVQNVDHHTVVSGNTFCNPGNIDFADTAPGVAKNLYPSHMFVSGVAGSIASVNLKLNGINHPRPDDMDFLLVAPNGATFVAMTDSGGTTIPAANVNLVLADSAATALPDLGPLVSGTFRPSSYLPVNDVFPAPAPVGPYNFAASDGTATFTSVFGGTNPNGTWSLFVVDDVANGGQVASVANGWCLEFVLNQPPTITCPANITVANNAGQCSASVAFVPTATGIPAPTVQCKIGVTTITSPHVFPVGTTTVDCTAQNAGGSATCSFTVTVNDTQPPTISCPANISVGNAAGMCSATVNFTIGANDNCPGVTVVANPASGSSFPIGTTTVNATATDASGNTAMCSFTVTVTDTQNPTISCPANITVNNDPGQCSAVVNFTVGATDNCPGVTVVSSPASGSTFPVGTTTVNSTATDAAGRTATCSFTVTVNDTQNPVITCPANIVQTTAPGQCSATVNFNVTATDNCSGVTVVSTPASGSVFPVGTTTVMATATDAAGNTATCSFTVTVVNQAPVVEITGPASGSVFAVGTAITFTGTFTDNIGDVHTAEWTFTSGAQTFTEVGIVNEITGTVTASHTFNTAGVFLVSLKVTD